MRVKLAPNFSFGTWIERKGLPLTVVIATRSTLRILDRPCTPPHLTLHRSSSMMDVLPRLINARMWGADQEAHHSGR